MSSANINMRAGIWLCYLQYIIIIGWRMYIGIVMSVLYVSVYVFYIPTLSIMQAEAWG